MSTWTGKICKNAFALKCTIMFWDKPGIQESGAFFQSFSQYLSNKPYIHQQSCIATYIKVFMEPTLQNSSWDCVQRYFPNYAMQYKYGLREGVHTTCSFRKTRWATVNTSLRTICKLLLMRKDVLHIGCLHFNHKCSCQNCSNFHGTRIMRRTVRVWQCLFKLYQKPRSQMQWVSLIGGL